MVVSVELRAYLGSSNIYKVTSFQENSDLAALPQLTLEARVYMLGFQTRDPYISSIMGIEGICGGRFGDVKGGPGCIRPDCGDVVPLLLVERLVGSCGLVGVVTDLDAVGIDLHVAET